MWMYFYSYIYYFHSEEFSVYKLNIDRAEKYRKVPFFLSIFPSVVCFKRMNISFDACMNVSQKKRNNYRVGRKLFMVDPMWKTIYNAKKLSCCLMVTSTSIAMAHLFKILPYSIFFMNTINLVRVWFFTPFRTVQYLKWGDKQQTNKRHGYLHSPYYYTSCCMIQISR